MLFPPIVLLLTSYYGIEGAAVAWTARSCFNCMARLLVCRRLGPSVSPAVPALLEVAALGASALTACALIGPMPVWIATLSCTAIVVPLFAAMTLLDADQVAQLRRRFRSLMLRPWSAPLSDRG